MSLALKGDIPLMKMYKVIVRYPHKKYAKKNYRKIYYVLADNKASAEDKVRKLYEDREEFSEYCIYGLDCDDVEYAYDEESY